MLRDVKPIVKCPTCQRPVEWTERQQWRPFCSERCRLIDLGEWVTGNRSIPGEPVDPEDLTQDDPIN